VSDGDRFFGADDPEWAVSQLAAQVAATAKARRRVSWHIVFGSVLTTVLVVGAFVLGLNGIGTAEPEAGSDRPQVSLDDEPAQLPRARLVTLVPKPEPTSTPTPQPASPPPPPAVVTLTVTPSPDHPEAPKPPSNQVGPNRPITTPIDPDDR